MASFVAVVPLMWMNDMSPTLTADVCQSQKQEVKGMSFGFEYERVGMSWNSYLIGTWMIRVAVILVYDYWVWYIFHQHVLEGDISGEATATLMDTANRSTDQLMCIQMSTNKCVLPAMFWSLLRFRCSTKQLHRPLCYVPAPMCFAFPSFQYWWTKERFIETGFFDPIGVI